MKRIRKSTGLTRGGASKPAFSNIDENIVGFGGEKSRTHVVSAEPPAKASRTSKTASRPKAPSVSSKAPSSPQVSSKMKRCQKCNLDIHRQSWSRHVRSHGDEKISCDLCGQDFTRLDHLKRHRVKHCHRWIYQKHISNSSVTNSP